MPQQFDDDDGPMTEDEKQFLLNDSILRAPAAKLTRESTDDAMKKKRLSPVTLLLFKKIGGKDSGKLLRCLVDSGGSNTAINESAIPEDAEIKVDTNATPVATIGGTFNSNRSVKLRGGFLPEFDRHKTFYGVTATVFNNPECPYDIILGRDLLNELGIVIDFANFTIKWFDRIVSMKPPNHFHLHTNWAMVFDRNVVNLYDDDDPIADESFIMDAKYEATSPHEVAEKQTHLSEHQRRQLEQALADTVALFDGNLGHYKYAKIKLELEPGAQPVHAKAYSVPKQHEPAFLKELRHLVDIGVLEPCGPSEWASPTFIIPKKDGRVRWISDLRELNKVLKRKVYPLPLIDEVVARRSGYKYFTKLDLTMMYYSFELDDESKDLCTIVTPYGKFRYRRMAMGLKPAPDFCQYYIEKTLQDLKQEGVEVYIDDVGIFSNSYEEHMILIRKVVQRLQDAGFKINPLKCEWCVQETDFLGHWLTPKGIKPWRKKIDAVLQMSKPRTTTELRSFLGAVTFYRHAWPRRSHLLHPLTQLTSRSNLSQWDEQCDKAFEEMKKLMASDVLLHYPDPNKGFELYTDASDYQMGAVIMQDGRPVAYWSRKLNAAQMNYSVMEKEMLSIVHCLKEFRSMLYGTNLTIFTDHKNLTFRTLNTQRVLRWRMFMEEFGPTFKYLPGKENVIADCFSRLPRMEKPSEGKSAVSTRGKLIAFQELNIKMDPDDDEFFSFEADVQEPLVPPPTEEEFNKTFRCQFSCCRNSDLVDDPEVEGVLHEAFFNHPALNVMQNPITMERIQYYQVRDLPLMQRAQLDFEHHPVLVIDGRNIICYRQDPQANPNHWKICLPEGLVDQVLVWYHLVLGHRGQNSMYQTISRRFQYSGLKQKVENFRCEICQLNKPVNAQYGHLPARFAPLIPWFDVQIDLIGPWKITVNGIELEFSALTCIDPVTNLTEIAAIENKTAAHVFNVFEHAWLQRYPKPFRCIHDQGGEFIGEEFQRKLVQWGIDDVPTTSKNATANAICERMHLTVGNILRTRFNNNVAPNVAEAQQAVKDALAAANHAMRCAVSKSLANNTPGEVVFGRDMLLNIPVIIDLMDIQNKRQLQIDENLRRQNAKRREYDYRIGHQVLLKVPNPNKLDPRYQGPFVITQVYTNGTVEIQRTPTVRERLNIRRLVPFRPRQV